MPGKYILLLSLALWMSVGCNSRHGKNFADPAEMERYAALPLASATHDPALRAELAQIVAEKATPAQLDVISKGGPPAAAVTSGDHIRGELIDIFPTDTRDRLVKRLATIYPDENFRFAPLIREAAHDLLQFAGNRQRSYQQLMLSDDLPPMHSHRFGMAADTDYLAAVEIGNRLLGLSIADSLETNRLPQALEYLDAMFRSAEWLGREKHPIQRVAAARRRVEALAAMGAIARHPAASQETNVKLLELMERQLANWPPDADAWIGERAEGLHIYELVRDGYLLSVLPFEQLRKYRETIGVERLGEVVAANLDQDQLYFLTTMRQVIASCAQPYYQRAPLFEQMEAELDGLRSSDQYPFIADQLLLLDIAGRQRAIALDRARCEAWRLALSYVSATGSPTDVINPVTGQIFAIQKSGDKLSISDIGDDEPAIELPVRGEGGESKVEG